MSSSVDTVNENLRIQQVYSTMLDTFLGGLTAQRPDPTGPSTG